MFGTHAIYFLQWIECKMSIRNSKNISTICEKKKKFSEFTVPKIDKICEFRYLDIPYCIENFVLFF